MDNAIEKFMTIKKSEIFLIYIPLVKFLYIYILMFEKLVTYNLTTDAFDDLKEKMKKYISDMSDFTDKDKEHACFWLEVKSLTDTRSITTKSKKAINYIMTSKQYEKFRSKLTIADDTDKDGTFFTIHTRLRCETCSKFGHKKKTCDAASTTDTASVTSSKADTESKQRKENEKVTTKAKKKESLIEVDED